MYGISDIGVVLKGCMSHGFYIIIKNIGIPIEANRLVSGESYCIYRVLFHRKSTRTQEERLTDALNLFFQAEDDSLKAKARAIKKLFVNR